MSRIGTGLLLALQFFSVIPVKKELPLEKNDVTSMYLALPVIGAFFGGLLALCTWLLIGFTDSSSLLIAFVIVVLGIFLTGGLHMDGVADVGDAYFSYQDRKKRLEIMGDPRIGAFGAMSLLFIVLGKLIVVAEIIQSIPFVVIVLIPILSRLGLLLLFTQTKSAKETGLAAFFQKQANRKQIAAGAIAIGVIVLAALVYVLGLASALGLTVVFLIFLYWYRKWCLTNFGGVTGDLFGAFLEGAEFILWIALLFFI